MNIDKDILDKTTKCTEDFACLKDKNHHCLKSKIDSSVNNTLIFINCNTNICSYHMNFGNSVICHCPIRKAIYFKYKI